MIVKIASIYLLVAIAWWLTTCFIILRDSKYHWQKVSDDISKGILTGFSPGFLALFVFFVVVPCLALIWPWLLYLIITKKD